MMTALSVRVPERRQGLGGLADRLKRDRVEVELLQARGVKLRHIVYTSYSGELKLEKTDLAVGAERERLLCSDRLIFPGRSGYRRFSSTAFSSRLCANFALGVLRGCRRAAELSAAIYDPEAYCADLLPAVLEYCSDVTVVTSCFEPYFYMADRALEEMGAAVMVTKNRAELLNRDLVIAPSPVAERLEISPNTVVLTAGSYPAETKGEVYNRYRFKMPNGFSDIKPAELSEEYFCSALYTLGSQHELGSIVPLSAYGKAREATLGGMIKRLDNRT